MSEFKTDDDFLDQPMDFGDLPPDPEAVSILFLFLLRYRKKGTSYLTHFMVNHKHTMTKYRK